MTNLSEKKKIKSTISFSTPYDFLIQNKNEFNPDHVVIV